MHAPIGVAMDRQCQVGGDNICVCSCEMGPDTQTEKWDVGWLLPTD